MPPSTRTATSSPPAGAEVVVDASALVDLLLGGPLGDRVAARIAGRRLHSPAHLDAEVLSALGRIHRAGDLSAAAVETLLGRLVAAPIARHPVTALVAGAWSRRGRLRLADALYVELAAALDLTLVTTDRRLAALPGAEVVSA